jgi:hypothetical protein
LKVNRYFGGIYASIFRVKEETEEKNSVKTSGKQGSAAEDGGDMFLRNVS